VNPDGGFSSLPPVWIPTRLDLHPVWTPEYAVPLSTMKSIGPALNKKKMSRRSSAAVALTMVLGFSLIYAVTAFWRPSGQDAGNCTACCILPESLGELEPIPLDESDWPLKRDTFSTEPAFEALSDASRRPTLAEPPAGKNAAYGPALEIVVEAKQVGEPE
jgi:hypothetical protein